MATHAHLDRLASPSEGQEVGKGPGEGVLIERQWNGCSSSSLALLGMPTAWVGAEQAEHWQKANRARISRSSSFDRIMLMEISHQVVIHFK